MSFYSVYHGRYSVPFSSFSVIHYVQSSIQLISGYEEKALNKGLATSVLDVGCFLFVVSKIFRTVKKKEEKTKNY